MINNTALQCGVVLACRQAGTGKKATKTKEKKGSHEDFDVIVELEGLVPRCRDSQSLNTVNII